MAVVQGQVVPAQVAIVGERRCYRVRCECRLASKGHPPVTFGSLVWRYAGWGPTAADPPLPEVGWDEELHHAGFRP
jgi:hypothetical protein